MPTAVPAMSGHFGTTDYYVVIMRAKELAEKLTIPKDLEDWEDMTIEERFQREINYSRVRKHIAPYLANDTDRFFGAFIVDIYNDDGMEFESLDTMISKLPGLYKTAAQTFGFLTFQGNEVLVPLDGQHRLAAIQFAISGKDEKSKDIDGLQANIEVANDCCTVILVKHDKTKSRNIFNKVNRYAKATTKADNLITADDDIVAVITREVVAGEVIGDALVNYKSNTLSKSASEFTTLSVLYDATGRFLEDIVAKGKIDRTALPPLAEENLYKTEAREFWDTIAEKIHIFCQALQNKDESGNDKRIDIRKTMALGKPIIQFALVDAILRLSAADPKTKKRLGLDEICERINKIDWGVDNSMWQRVLMNGDKVITGKQSARFAARFISYLLGEPLHEKEIEGLRCGYRSARANDAAELPDRIFQP